MSLKVVGKSLDTSFVRVLTPGLALVLGRSRETGIRDKSVSKSQVKLEANKHGAVTLTTLGRNPASFQGDPVKQDQSVELSRGQSFCLLHSAPTKYIFCIERSDSHHDAFSSSSSREVSPDRTPKRAKTSAGKTPTGTREWIKDGTRVKLPDGWTCHGGSVLVQTFGDVASNEKIASFDFDGCLAKTSVANHDPTAWKLRFANVPSVLQKYHRQGYKLVVFTNESAERLKKQPALDAVVHKKTTRLRDFVKAAGVPMQVFIMLRKDKYRKPNTGVFDLLQESFNDGITIDKRHSFFVGDAAGRKGDHGNSDLEFAKGVGLPFHTETEFFRS